jgi:hypothetical protein
MKKLIILCIVSLSVFSLQAQISKGSSLLGFNVGFSNYSSLYISDKYDAHSLGLSASLGFAKKENKVIGFFLGYGQSKYDQTQNSSNNHYYSTGIFKRSYLGIGKGFYLFGQGTLGINYNTSSTHSPSGETSKYEGKGISAVFNPGIAYSVSRHFHLELAFNQLASLSYGIIKTTESFPGAADNIQKNQSIGLGVNANPVGNLSLGFRFILGK